MRYDLLMDGRWKRYHPPTVPSQSGSTFFGEAAKRENSMRKSREVLLRLYHDPAYRFVEAEVCYVDRGAPGDMSCIGGDRIIRLDPYFIEIESEKGTTPIPYHRLIRIRYQGRTMWERGRRGAPPDGS